MTDENAVKSNKKFFLLPVTKTLRLGQKKKIDAKAIVWLSDGYLGCNDPVTPMPSLWGIVDNDDFVAAHGKTLHINV